MKTPMIALAAASLAITGAPALAGETGDNMVVSYKDLNLSSAEGQKTLDRRINAAAKKYCRANIQRSGTRLSSGKTDQCVREAKRLAQQQFARVIDDAQLGG